MKFSRCQRFPCSALKISFSSCSTLQFSLLFLCLQSVSESLTCTCDMSKCPKLPRNCTNLEINPCTCCPVCIKEEGERCGGWMNSEGTCRTPSFSCAYRLGSILGPHKAGICEPENCNDEHCNFRQRCALNRATRLPQCGCPQFNCNGKYNPVCGNDNIEYLSVCRLQKEECALGKFIGIKNFGGCPPPNTEAPENSLPSVTPKSCIYNNNIYTIGDDIPSTDPCIKSYCSSNGKIKIVEIPGCGDNPPEKDWRVERSLVNGSWSTWTSWSMCSGRCGAAFRNRSRKCNNPPPQNEGHNCTGLSIQERPCILEDCSLEEKCKPFVGGWSYWSPCNSACGVGQMSRRRLINHGQLLQASLAEKKKILTECLTEETATCSVTSCNSGSTCQANSTFDYITIEHPLKQNRPANEWYCRSIQRYRRLVCSGGCPNGGANSCCRPNGNRAKRVIFKCDPNSVKQRIEYIKFPYACQCNCN